MNFFLFFTLIIFPFFFSKKNISNINRENYILFDAIKLNNKKKYSKSIKLFEKFLKNNSNLKKKKIVLYNMAMNYFFLKKYFLAAKSFEKFYKKYRKNQDYKTKNALFMSSYCYYILSPKHYLDQTITKIAIKKFIFFCKKYPNYNNKEIKKLIKDLNEKIEKKDFEISKQYYKKEEYRANIKSLENFIKKFPNSKIINECFCYIIISNYKMSIN